MVLNHVESCSIIITIVNVILKINSRLLRIFYRLFATSCSEMRNTMDKKKKILIGAVLTVVILLAGVMAGFLIANAEKKGSSPQNVENGALTNNERPVYDEKESTESPKNQEAQAQFTPGNAWESDGRKYIQYELNIFSTGKKNIESWKITFPAGSGTVMEQSWNCGVESSTAEDGTVSFTLSPVDYNREIPA